MHIDISNRYRARQLGASLIEAVVALFIFSVGVLGVAAIQASTLVRSDDVKQRSLAVWKAQELADRMRSTRTVSNPGGLLESYRNALGGDVSSIESFAERSDYQCPANAPATCDDMNGAPAGSCDVDEIVAFDLWSVICDAATGASDANISGQDGINKLKDLDVALVRGGAAGENFLYFSWLSRNAERNTAFQGGANTVETLLCGETRDVDSRLDAYCLRLF